jgi:hypothetical protein
VLFAEVKIEVSVSSFDSKVSVNARSALGSYLETYMSALLGFRNPN